MRALFITPFLLALPLTATATSIAYDQTYDNPSLPFTSVACSDGINGLITRYGWKVLSNAPKYPLVGAFSTVTGWNSPNCGKCYTLTYDGRSISVLAVDVARGGAGGSVVLSLKAMDQLTGGKAVMLGRVDGQLVEVDKGLCGL